MVEYGALEQCLREGFIDYTVEADQRYVPKILTNNKDKNARFSIRFCRSCTSAILSCFPWLF